VRPGCNEEREGPNTGVPFSFKDFCRKTAHAVLFGVAVMPECGQDRLVQYGAGVGYDAPAVGDHIKKL
jgi:hypothetical protein